MEKSCFYYNSKVDGKKIHAVKFVPKGQIIAVLQVAHGMQEYIARYVDFAEYMCKNGVLVVGNDHRGHGSTAETEEELGYFIKDNPAHTVLSDMHTLTEIIKAEYPELPYFLLGHSMGSFFTRRYICEYANLISGAIIMGTGYQPRLLVKTGKLLTRVVAAFKGDKHRSRLIKSIAFGAYNKRIKPLRTNMDWLANNPEIIDKYIADKYCNFSFTLNGYYGMFDCIDSLYNKNNLAKMPKALPVLFISGSADPVGDYGKGVKKAYNHFEKAGMQNIYLKLYEGYRHEILNELQNVPVYIDIYNWLKTQMINK